MTSIKLKTSLPNGISPLQNSNYTEYADEYKTNTLLHQASTIFPGPRNRFVRHRNDNNYTDIYIFIASTRNWYNIAEHSVEKFYFFHSEKSQQNPKHKGKALNHGEGEGKKTLATSKDNDPVRPLPMSYWGKIRCSFRPKYG